MYTFLMPDGRKVRRSKPYIVAYFVKEPTRCHAVLEPEWRVDRAYDDSGKAKSRAIQLSRYSRGRVISAQP
ncbi:MAG: hypothetical protein ACO3JL_14470 [Myxococcota bacterium]